MRGTKFCAIPVLATYVLIVVSTRTCTGTGVILRSEFQQPRSKARSFYFVIIAGDKSLDLDQSKAVSLEPTKAEGTH